MPNRDGKHYGICKLCGQHKELQKSHILPKGLYDLKRTKRFTAIERETGKTDRINFQNGFKEYLLCKDCEEKFCVFDKEAIKFFHTTIPAHPFRKVGKLQTYLVTYQDFDYNKLRKFFISLVWRASISSENVSLGIYEDVAKRILTGDVSDNDDLFLIEIYRRNKSILSDRIVIGNARNHNGHSATFQFPGYGVIITTTAKAIPFQEKQLLKKLFNKTEILVIESDDFFIKSDIQFLNDFYIATHNMKFLNV